MLKVFAKTDKIFLGAIIALLVGGLFVFASAALGVLSSSEVKFYSILENQLVFALILGIVALFIGTAIPFTFYQKNATALFVTGLVITLFVFIPGIQMYHGGAHRWIAVGSFSLQPSEFLKFASVVFIAYWCTLFARHFKNIYFGFAAFLAIIGSIAVVMLLQPDFGTFLIILFAVFSVYFVGGATKKHMLLCVLAAVIGFLLLIMVRPYMMERVKTFFNSSHDVQGSSWQLNQSLIAIGSGGFLGRGYGQSVQKFNYLPEPIGDSIFAVLGEELGFFGVGALFILYGIVIIRGLRIAFYSESQFGRLLAVGIISLLVGQIIFNVGSMIGILPLTGVPLPFVSHGGTALMILLFEIGVVLNISKQSNYV